MNTRLLATLLALGAGQVQAQAGGPLPGTDDGPQGMTCHYFLAAANLEWDRPGGDWLDAKSQRHGDQPFSTVRVTRSKSPQLLDWDVTALARSWVGNSNWPGAVYLRAEPGQGAGTVEFQSRERAAALAPPQLHLHWSDGTVQQLAATADTHMACPNFKSSGKQSQVKVASGVGAMILFQVTPRAGLVIDKAVLTLASGRQTGAGATVGAYAGRRPGGGVSAVQQGLAADTPLDRGLERHPDVWFVERFEAPTQVRAWLNDKDVERLTFVSTSARRQAYEALDGAAMVVTLAAGSTQAMNSHLALAKLAGSEPDEAFFRYYLRLGENWNPSADGGKLPGLSGTYGQAGWGGRRADGVSGWSARGSFYQQARAGSAVAELRAVGSYVYHAGMSGRYGSNWGWNLGPTGVLQKNRWYSVEQQVRLNTPGQPDGVFRAWIDGQLVFEKTDVRYRDTDTLKIESVWMNVYHGGTKPTPRDMTLYIDNLVVARRYIGPMSTAAGKKP